MRYKQLRSRNLPAEGLPSGGSPGDVLTRSADGASWAPSAGGGGGGGDFEARVAALEAAITGKQSTSERNQANGYAGLDGSGRIPLSRVPAEISNTAVAIHRKTENFTITTGDLGGLFVVVSAGAVVCTIPVNTGGSFAAAGEGCSFIRAGSGGLSFAGTGTASYNSATGITTFADGQKIMSELGFLAMAEIGSAATLVRDDQDANLWYLNGGLE